MIKVVNAVKDIDRLYTDDSFDLAKWNEYIKFIPENIFYQDMLNTIGNGDYSFEDDYLPVLNSLITKPDKIQEIVDSFNEVTKHLEETIIKEFKKTIDVNVVLYLGLCNGAGWATTINGEDYVLLGIEKIVELNWCSVNDMRGLLWHELGHIYQSRHGVLDRELEGRNKYLWLMYTEGIAMYFEQRLSGKRHFFHQDKNGWLDSCTMLKEILIQDFNNDLDYMTDDNQDYFGDWVSHRNLADAGYYIGSIFVWELNKKYDFDTLINLDINTLNKEWNEFVRKNS